MKLITRDTDYAIRALGFIGKRKNKVVSVPELVEELKMPRPFLRKILQILNKRGILKSYRGTGGGFLLTGPANKIFLLDLVRIFQGPFKLNECSFKKNTCPNTKKCLLKKKFDALERGIIKELGPITIAHLLQ